MKQLTLIILLFLIFFETNVNSINKKKIINLINYVYHDYIYYETDNAIITFDKNDIIHFCQNEALKSSYLFERNKPFIDFLKDIKNSN
jgi:hypothetical protein